MFESPMIDRTRPFVPDDADWSLLLELDPVGAAQDDAEMWAWRRNLIAPMAATDAVESAVEGLPGPELATFLAGLPERAGVDGWTVVEAIKGYEKVMRWAAAQQLTWIAELARRRPDVRSKWARGPGEGVGGDGLEQGTPADQLMGRVGHDAAVEVAFALGESTRVAMDLLYQAVTLTARLPVTLAALSSGQVSRRAAAVVAEETAVLDTDVAADLDVAVADRIVGRTAPQVRACVRRAVLAADPAAADAREAKAVRQRCFDVDRQVVDGMGTFGGCAPIADVVAIDRRVRALADAAKTPGDGRSAAARRMDVVADLLLGRPTVAGSGSGLDSGSDSRFDSGQCRSTRAGTWRVDVVVSAETLCGTDEVPAELAGYGPLTAGTARMLAGQPDSSVWRRIVTDPLSGIVTDCGTERYVPPPDLADLVRARDRLCHAPGCRQPAARCDLDHVLNSPVGPSPRPDPSGATADWNLGPLCRTHHTCKAKPGWQVNSPTPGEFDWTTPTGHTYRTVASPPLEPPPFEGQPWPPADPSRGVVAPAPPSAPRHAVVHDPPPF